MNVPSRGEGNWSWRCPPGALTGAIARKLAELAEVTDRDHAPEPVKDEDPKELQDEGPEELDEEEPETRQGESLSQAAAAHPDA